MGIGHDQAAQATPAAPGRIQGRPSESAKLVGSPADDPDGIGAAAQAHLDVMTWRNGLG